MQTEYICLFSGSLPQSGIPLCGTSKRTRPPTPHCGGVPLCGDMRTLRSAHLHFSILQVHYTITYFWLKENPVPTGNGVYRRSNFEILVSRAGRRYCSRRRVLRAYRWWPRGPAGGPLRRLFSDNRRLHETNSRSC